MAEPVKIKAGEHTTEYIQAKENGFWAKILIVLGMIVNIGGVVMQSLQQVQEASPAVAENKTFMIIMLIVGTVIMIAGGVQKALTDAAYINGRSLVKAAAARDATPPPEV